MNTTTLAPRRIPSLLMFVLGAIALGVAGYLAVQTAVLGSEPIGCGAGSGCAEVLSSKWSRWYGVPVSALAAGLYVGLLWNLVAIRRAEPSRQRRIWSLLLAAATIILGAGVWFTVLQLFVLGELCIYCMADHLCGATLAIVIFCEARFARRVGSIRLVAGVLLGAAATAALVAGQVSSTAIVHRIAILDGALDLVPADEPLLGSPDADCVLAVMYDYSCPHCRHTHGLLQRVREREGESRLAVISLHVPMNRDCNPHAPEGLGERFANSCELARLALAVRYSGVESARADFEAFDRWLFEPEEPRTPRAARAEAERLIGAAALDAALKHPGIDERIRRNVESFKKSGAARVPVTMATGVDAIVGRIEEERVIVDLVAAALAKKRERDE